MDYSDEQRKLIANSIREIDRVGPECDLMFEKFDSAKLKCGFAFFFSGLLLIGVLSGNYEIQESIGTWGVGSLPFVFVGSIFYYLSVRKKYDQKIYEFIKAEQPLLDLGVGYTPITRHFSKRRLWLIKTSEELNIGDFE